MRMVIGGVIVALVILEALVTLLVAGAIGVLPTLGLGLLSTLAGSVLLRRQGLMRSIACLDPHETLSPGQAEEIDQLYATYPEWADDAFVAQNLHRWRS